MKIPTRKPKGLIIGTIDKSTNAYIEESNRKKHTVVLGAKGTGKSEAMLPSLVKQDLENKKNGVTIVTGNKEISMLLYSLAKRHGRDVHIIKPSITDSGKTLLTQCCYDYNAITEYVINFEQAIRKKEVVIIDMEFAIHQDRAIQGVAYLLHAFHEAMTRENEAKETPHYLYVDDSHLYFPYVQPILMNGGDYGVGCVLFLESRQFLNDVEKAYLDSATRNKIILSRLTISDAKYVAEEIYERQLVYLLNRKKFDIVYLTEAKDSRTQGVCQLKPLDDELMASLRLSVPRHRGNIERSQLPQIKTEAQKSTAINQDSSIEKESANKQSEDTPLKSLDSSQKTDVIPPGENDASETPQVKPSKSKPLKAKEKVMMPEQRQREKITKQIQKESKRHVVQLDNLFDDEEEF